MRPAMRMALAVCLASTMYVSLQSESSDDLTAPRARRTAEEPRHRVAAVSGKRHVTAPRADEHRALSVALRRWHASQRQVVLAGSGAETDPAWASQQPPPPPPVAADAAVSAPPVAPTFPHAWVGRYLDPLPKAIIVGPGNTWVTAAGDVLEGQWRIDAIHDRRMTLTYLPLDQSQTVAMK